MKLPGLPKREDPKRLNTIDLDSNTNFFTKCWKVVYCDDSNSDSGSSK